jgi:hypothetical protein
MMMRAGLRVCFQRLPQAGWLYLVVRNPYKPPDLLVATRSFRFTGLGSAASASPPKSPKATAHTPILPSFMESLLAGGRELTPRTH